MTHAPEPDGGIVIQKPERLWSLQPTTKSAQEVIGWQMLDYAHLRGVFQDKGHKSGTAYPGDNYTQEHVTPEWSPRGWTHILRTEDFACHDPEKVWYKEAATIVLEGTALELYNKDKFSSLDLCSILQLLRD